MKTFAQKLDFRILVAGEMVKDHGEDNFYSVMGENCAVAAVFDGSGGIGSRKYPKYMDHTGAYMASRAVSGAIHDWYHESMESGSGLAKGREAAAQMRTEQSFSASGREIPVSICWTGTASPSSQRTIWKAKMP